MKINWNLILQAIIFIGVLAIIIFSMVITIHGMEDRIRSDCAKQNYEGIKEYWDTEIDCKCFNPNFQECWEVVK